MKPSSFEELIKRILKEFEAQRSIFYINEKYFYKSEENINLSCIFRNKKAYTPLGPAAGPHTQLAQNIISAWLCGARIIELKTVQIMDDLEIPRPCIDVTNMCFNVEWSQELKIEQSLREYVKAWYLIHIIKNAKIVNFDKNEMDTIFDLSVGYDLEGIKSKKVMYFIKNMINAESIINELRKELPLHLKKYADLEINPKIATGVTLSTFHGCPPDEIEKIATFLMKEIGLDTVIKLNPTLLGYEKIKEILHEQLGYHTLELIPEAFQKDLQWESALEIIKNLKKVAQETGRHFGIKFNNTLITKNNRNKFSPEEMYLSGRPLHVIGINLVSKIREVFGDEIDISFSAGIDIENFCDCVACNLIPITVCTDILRPGGYTRLYRYLKKLENEIKSKEINTREEYILNYSLENTKQAIKELNNNLNNEIKKDNRYKYLERFVHELYDWSNKKDSNINTLKSIFNKYRNNDKIKEFYKKLVKKVGVLNTKLVLQKVNNDKRYSAYKNRYFSPKVNFKSTQFDCISAPCIYACPINMLVPDYIELIKRNEYSKAFDIIMRDNPLPSVCSRVCSHPCEEACRQQQWDKSISIKYLKRVPSDKFIDELDYLKNKVKPSKDKKVAIIGSGPAGLTASYFLALEGYKVTVFEALDKIGGMLATSIPSFRLPTDVLNKEIERIKRIGVEFKLNTKIGEDGIPLRELQKEYSAIFIATGTPKGRKLGIKGENSKGCMDALQFLTLVKAGKNVELGEKVAVIGGGNSAVDTARTAWRLGAKEVFIIYRRTISEMLADIVEIENLIEEGIKIYEKTIPIKIIVKDNKVKGLECLKTKLGKMDKTGRAKPIPIPESKFEIEADTVLIAISQQTDLDSLIKNTDIKISPQNTLVVNPNTLETNVPGIFAGGDVVNGADTLIRAMGHGKKAAISIINYLERKESNEKYYKTRKDTLIPKEEYRLYPWEIKPQKPDEIKIEERKNFNEVEHKFSDEQAQKEASRCLKCDVKCGICIEVCPNRANFFFKVQPEETPCAILGYKEGKIIPLEQKLYKITKEHQIGNIIEWCNECGNCDNFCPEIGGPYKTKSLFFKTLENFKSSTRDGYFIDVKLNKIDAWGRIEGIVHHLEVDLEEDKALFNNGMIKVELKYSNGVILNTIPLIESSDSMIDMENFFKIRTLCKANLGFISEK